MARQWSCLSSCKQRGFLLQGIQLGLAPASGAPACRTARRSSRAARPRPGSKSTPRAATPTRSRSRRPRASPTGTTSPPAAMACGLSIGALVEQLPPALPRSAKRSYWCNIMKDTRGAKKVEGRRYCLLCAVTACHRACEHHNLQIPNSVPDSHAYHYLASTLQAPKTSQPSRDPCIDKSFITGMPS